MFEMKKWTPGKEVIDWKEFRAREKKTNLPILIDTSDIGVVLEIPTYALTFLITVKNSIITSAKIPKQNGKGVRHLYYPNVKAKDEEVAQGAELLKHVQKKLLYTLFQNFPISEAAYGFIDGKDVIKCAGRHVGKSIVVAFDIQSFFPNTTYRKIRNLFQNYAPWSQKAIWTIAELVTYKGHTPQGFSTSPMLSNIVMYEPDTVLSSWAKKHGWEYTRYADDLIFSKNGDPLSLLKEVVNELHPLVDAQVKSKGYHIKENKTKIMPKPGPQTVLGIRVNEKLNLPRRKFDLLKAKVHNPAVKRRLPAEVISEYVGGNRNAITKYFRKLSGEVAWAKKLNPEKVKPVERMLVELIHGQDNYRYEGPIQQKRVQAEKGA